MSHHRMDSGDSSDCIFPSPPLLGETTAVDLTTFDNVEFNRPQFALRNREIDMQHRSALLAVDDSDGSTTDDDERTVARRRQPVAAAAADAAAAAAAHCTVPPAAANAPAQNPVDSDDGIVAAAASDVDVQPAIYYDSDLEEPGSPALFQAEDAEAGVGGEQAGDHADTVADGGAGRQWTPHASRADRTASSGGNSSTTHASAAATAISASAAVSRSPYFNAAPLPALPTTSTVGSIGRTGGNSASRPPHILSSTPPAPAGSSVADSENPLLPSHRARGSTRASDRGVAGGGGRGVSASGIAARRNRSIANDHGHLSLRYHNVEMSRASVHLDAGTSLTVSVTQVDVDSSDDDYDDDAGTDVDDDDEEGGGLHQPAASSATDSGEVVIGDSMPVARTTANRIGIVDVSRSDGDAHRVSTAPDGAAAVAGGGTAATSTTAVPSSATAAAATGHAMRVVSGSPLADLSMAEFETKKPKKRSHAEVEENEESEEGNVCTICFDEWTNAGSHRISALKCGHLYGFSCIDRWVRSNGTCPQCKAKCKRADIRKLYANKISALDTAERDKALEQLQGERRERLRVEAVAAQYQLQNTLLQQECQRMKQQLMEHQRARQLATSSSGTLAPAMSSNSSNSLLPAATPTVSSASALLAGGLQRAGSKNFAQYKNISVAQAEARVMDFDRSNGILVVSRPSARENQLLRGAGLVKVSMQDSRHMEYVNIHTQRIRDVSVSRDSIALTASEDKSLRLTSLISNTVVQKYSVPTPAWSCCWHCEEPQYFFAGLQNNKVLMFDVRNTSHHVGVVGSTAADGGGDSALPAPALPCGPPLSGPVVSMRHIAPGPSSGSFRDAGLLVCRTTGLSFYRHLQGVDYAAVPLLNGNTYNVAWESSVRHGLVSLRPGKNNKHVQHVLFQLSGGGFTDGNSHLTGGLAPAASTSASSSGGQARLDCVMPLAGGVSARVLSKSSLFLHPENNGSLVASVPDESAQAVMMFDCQQGSVTQRLTCLSSGQKDILHSRHFVYNGEHFIGALTETNMALFKWT